MNFIFSTIMLGIVFVFSAHNADAMMKRLTAAHLEAVNQQTLQNRTEIVPPVPTSAAASLLTATEPLPSSLVVSSVRSSVPVGGGTSPSSFATAREESSSSSLSLRTPPRDENLSESSTSLRTPSSPVAPVTSAATANWSETFTCKNGLVVTHSPTGITYKTGNITMSAGKSVNMNNSSLNGRIVNLHLSTDMTRDQFVAALRRDGNL